MEGEVEELEELEKIQEVEEVEEVKTEEETEEEEKRNGKRKGNKREEGDVAGMSSRASRFRCTSWPGRPPSFGHPPLAYHTSNVQEREGLPQGS